MVLRFNLDKNYQHLPGNIWSWIYLIIKEHKWKFLGLSLCSIRIFIDSWVSADIVSIMGELETMNPSTFIMGSFMISLLQKSIFYLLLDIISFIQHTFFARIIPFTESHIKISVLSYIHKYKMSVFRQYQDGYFENKISELADGIQTLINTIYHDILPVTLHLLLSIVVFIHTSPILGLIFFTYLIICLCISYLLSTRARRYSAELQRTQNHTTATILDSIANILTVKIYGVKDQEINYCEKVQGEEFQAYYKNLFFCSVLELLSAILYCAEFFLFNFLLVVMWKRHVITGGKLIHLFVLHMRNCDYLYRLVIQIPEFITSLGQCDESLTIINKNYIEDPHNMNNNLCLGDNPVLEFKNVTCKLQGKKILNNTNFTIKKGDKVLIMGPSGVGKTSIFNLIMKLSLEYEGDISLFQQNINKLQRKDIVKHITFVPQDALLFNRSLEYNLFFRENNNNNKPESLETLHITGMDKIVQEKSLTHYVGNRGSHLSGGQKQRVNISRSTIKPGELYLFDEITSALDISSREYVLNNLFLKTLRDKTILFISHNDDDMKYANRVLIFTKNNQENYTLKEFYPPKKENEN